MNGPIFAKGDEGRRDSSIHRHILNAVNFTKSKAIPLAVKRGESLGLTTEQVKMLLGK